VLQNVLACETARLQVALR